MDPQTSPVTIIGMGMSPEDLTARHLDLIRSAHVLVAGRRHLSYFQDHPGIRREITGNLKDTVRFLEQRPPGRRIVVLTSGDPLFFGIGAFLAKALGPEQVVIHPNVSSAAAAFSRLGLSWNDAAAVSLHGRKDTDALWMALSRGDKVVVFTDPVRNPVWLARCLAEGGLTGFDMWVLERMGTPQERTTLLDAASPLPHAAFADPNVVVLVRRTNPPGPAPQPALGMAEDCFEHDRGLITKAEVRAVTLAKLALKPGQVLWDLGSGSGSVAIEASLFVPGGRIIAVEKNPDRVRQIEANRRRFGIANMQVVQAVLPRGLAELPRPDRVFIGGGGSALEAIVRASVDRLEPGGRVVVNTVILASVNTAFETLFQLGLDPDVVQIQISRSTTMPRGWRLQAENPVFVIAGRAPGRASGARRPTTQTGNQNHEPIET